MKTRAVLHLLLIIGGLPLSSNAAAPPGITYHIEWPSIHLDGTFTLDVGPAFGNYFSTSALGTYGGSSGQYSVLWTSVELNAQPTRVDLTFIWDQGYTGFGYNAPTGSPWTTAESAWSDLVTRGAMENVSITIV